METLGLRSPSPTRFLVILSSFHRSEFTVAGTLANDAAYQSHFMRSRLVVFITLFVVIFSLESVLYKGGFFSDCMPEVTRLRTALVLAFGLTWLWVDCAPGVTRKPH